MSRTFIPESLWLLAITSADLLSTIWLISSGKCIEINPIMNFFLKIGWIPFISFKLFTMLSAVVVAEWYRRKDEPFTRRWMRTGVISYAVIWTIWFSLANINH